MTRTRKRRAQGAAGAVAPTQRHRARRAQLWRPAWLAVAAFTVVVGALAWWLVVRSPAAGMTLASHRPPDVHALEVHPTDERTLVFGSHRGVLISRDGGATWSGSGPSGDAMGIAMPATSRTAFAAGHDAFLRSDDGGATWSAVRSGLPGTDIHGFAASATRPETFFAYVVGQGLFTTSDAARSWSPFGEAPPSTHGIAIARADGGDVFIVTTMEGLIRSRDGRTWEPVRNVPAGYVSASGSTVYVASGTSVYASRDAGATWQRRPFTGGKAALVPAVPSDPTLLYVVSDSLEVWTSRDAGATWRKVG